MDAIQDVFQQDYESYRRGKRLGMNQVKAARNIVRCRTGFFGVRMEQCPENHETRFRFNACHHRSCPQCNALPRQRWLESALPKLLPVAHRQVVFTIAHELLPLYQQNDRVFIQLLFSCVAWVLQRHLSDPRRLGATAGFLLAYHSWGRNLSLHPHIHALVSEGGLNTKGEWVAAKTESFLPARAMMHGFRGRLLSGLRRKLRKGELTLPMGMSECTARQLIEAAYRKHWNVKVEKRYAHGEGLVKYLARYLRGGPIRSQQITKTRDVVKLRYKDHRTGHRRSLCLTSNEFIRRLLNHVPPENQPMIRRYGLYSNRWKQELQQVQQQIQITRPRGYRPSQVEWNRSKWMTKKGLCETCGKHLLVTVMRSNSGW